MINQSLAISPTPELRYEREAFLRSWKDGLGYLPELEHEAHWHLKDPQIEQSGSGGVLAMVDQPMGGSIGSIQSEYDQVKLLAGERVVELQTLALKVCEQRRLACSDKVPQAYHGGYPHAMLDFRSCSSLAQAQELVQEIWIYEGQLQAALSVPELGRCALPSGRPNPCELLWTTPFGLRR